jgi:hypothetical protein
MTNDEPRPARTRRRASRRSNICAGCRDPALGAALWDGQLAAAAWRTGDA